ncbi:hypothetical protein B0T18DRAFT_330457 [Schizothecium vesticola]|uniref:Uncharacterized protein n=1 Tax=Schizothecium vesticola TaxID=314040 RepID=A0AA40EPI2_9PEZI|nr:hypothetical protein B0T18DRAFT_330457 [Schizothecium vesticola]
MPTLTAAQLVHRQKLCQKYRIEFLGEIDPSNWPDCHRDTLNDATEAASKRYHAYATNPALLGTDPWKMERKSHAMVLVENANRSHGRNESTWRHACDPVAVRERDGPWISKLETVGLNRIFNFRADEEVHHDPEITEELAKREIPDRVYGLRKTRNIELLLYDITSAERREPGAHTGVDQTNQPSAFQFMNQPMNAKGDHQLFPFLVLEAKTGSSDEWHAINMQTAFSIRTFLETQRQLYSAASARSEWKSRPLVWYFSNKGENWRLCAAYTEDAPAEPDRIGTTVYRVVDVWHGCITTRDGALQLLLLVDYLFDWARDRYREDIIGALRIVAHGESDAASGVYQDTDIFSTVPLHSIHRPSQVTEADGNIGSYISAQESFLALDSPAGVFRHATFVESRYYCLYITRDNVQTFLQSTTQSRVQPLCRLILGHMSKSILTDPDTLDAIEERWTGVSRSSAPSYRPQAQEQFHVVLSFTTYLSSEWHQVRELSAVAVTKDAWKVLGDASRFKKKLRSPFIYDYYDTAEFIRVVEKLKAGSPEHILHAAIVSTAYRIVVGGPHILEIQVDNGSLRDLVYFIYAWLKRGGVLEPDEPFLRSSKNFDQQHLREDHGGPYPLICEDSLQASDEGCVLVTATCEPKDLAGRRGDGLCVYLTEGGPTAPETEVLAVMMRKALETRDVYHTTRTSVRGPSFSALTQQGQSARGFERNIRGTYGVYSRGFGFLALLERLGGSEVPMTLGALRSPDGCGSQLYKRNISPWIDPRYIYLNSQSRMFILYKLFTREVLYWKGIARERERSDISCCPLCAALGDHDLCVACEEFLADDNQYGWFRNAILGESPLQMKALSGEEVKIRLRTMRDDYPVLKEDIAPRPHGIRNYDGNADWARKLDFYTKLEEPFNDIDELALQWLEFCRYCRENGPYFRRAGIPGNRKRKRPEGSDAEQTDNSSSDVEVSEEASNGAGFSGDGSDEEGSGEEGSDNEKDFDEEGFDEEDFD